MADSPVDVLSDAFYEARRHDLAQRLRHKRYEHSLGVADTAAVLARLYDADECKARLAGLLHDWDKAYDDEGIRHRVEDLHVSVDPYVFAEMPQLLHGPTAAAALSRAYPDIPADIIRAIELHTTGAVQMTDLDMIVYIADAIEPNRRYDGLDALRGLAGGISLDDLFVATFQHILLNLVERRKRVYPDTLTIWNHHLARSREVADAGSRKGTA